MSAKVWEHIRSNLIGYIALFCFAASSTAHALPGTNNVDSGDIKNHQVKVKDLAANSVGSPAVIDGSLTDADLSLATLKGITGPVGPKGDPGPQGPVGLQGPPGTASISPGSVTAVDLAPDSVGSEEIQTDAVQATEIVDNSIDGGEIVDNSLGTADLASDSVGNSELGDNAVSTANVTNNSLTMADLEGASVNGAISFSLGASTCGTLNFGVSGAEPGQVAIIGYTGSVALPPGVVAGPLRIVSAGNITGRFCNVTTSAVSVSSIGVRFITFG